MKEEVFERLVSDYLGGALCPEDTAAFKAGLLTDQDHLDLFVDRLLLEAELCRRGELGAIMEPSTSGHLWGRSRARQWIGSLAAAAAVLLLGAVVLYRTQVPEPPPFAALQASPHSLVAVSGGDANEPAEGALSESSVVAVSQGAAEISLAEGVRCLLPAPGRLRLDRAGQVTLLEGSARFEVAPAARGFLVRTAAVDVIDLGTEFAVDLARPDQPQVHVMKGTVEVRGRTGRRETSTITTGQAVAVGAVGRLEPVPLDAKRFPAELPTGLPALYFSFDSVDGTFLPAEGRLAERTGVHAVLDHDAAPRPAPGRFGGGLSFREADGYVPTNWPGIGGVEARTISLWVRLHANGEVGPYPLLGWGNWASDSGMSHLGLRVGRDPERGSVLRVVSGRRWLQGTTPLDDGEWHHVVVCMGSHRSKDTWPETSIFIDGEPEDWTAREPWPPDTEATPQPFFTEIHGFHSQPLVLGKFGDPKEEGFLPSFRGDLDEVIIAAGVLTREQVRGLYEGDLEGSGLDLGRTPRRPEGR